MKKYLPHSTGCFVCGKDNPHGLNHRFYVEDGCVKSDVFIPMHFCGFLDVVHGGISTALLDEPMGWAAFVFGDSKNLCFTRNIEVKFKRSVPTGTDLTVITQYLGKNRMLHEAEGKLVDSEGRTLVAAKGQFVEIPDGKMSQTMNFLLMQDGVKYHEKYLNLLKEVSYQG